MRTMKSIWCLTTIMMVAAMNLLTVSCSKDEVIPEIKIPAGSEDYFTKSMDFDSPSGEKKLTFTSNVAWTVSVSGSTWLSVTPTSGEAGTNTLTVKADENTTYDDRNAVITLTAGDSIRRVFVNQKQLDALTLTSDRFEVPVEGGEVKIEVKSNINFEAVIPTEYQSWIHKPATTRGLTSSTLVYKIDKSEEYDKREGKIIIKGNGKEETVSIYQTGEGILTLTQNEFNINSTEQEIDIEISSNFDYTVDMPDVDWISEITAQTRGISTHTLRLAISENQDYDGRSAKIKIYDKNSDLSEEVTINQAEGGAILILTQHDYELSSSAQEIDIEISSNFDYTVDMPDVDWIKEATAKTRGISTHTLKLAISENKGYDSRSAKIKIYDKNSDASEEVTINQNQKDALIIDKKEYSYDEKGGSIEVDVNSNIKYSISIDCDWITEKQTATTRGLEKTTHTFIISEMTGNSERVGNITFSNEETGISEKVVVTQTRALYFESDAIDIMEDGEKTISLINNTDQTVTWSSSDESVATVDNTGKAKGISKGSATITATTADGKHTCTCSVTVKDITDFIKASNLGGSISSINGLIQYGSKLNWSFINYSSETVHLKTMQLIDGQNGNEGNQMSVDTDVAAGSGVSYTTTIGLLGIHAPVTCRFRFDYKEKEYYVDAVYSESIFGF